MNQKELIKTLYQKLKTDPGSKVFAHLADELRRQGNFEDAIKIVNEGLEKHPDYPTAHVVLGRILRDIKDNKGAKDQFLEVLKVDPQNLLSLKMLGDLFLQDGDKNKAGEFYSRVLEINPANDVVKEILEELSVVIEDEVDFKNKDKKGEKSGINEKQGDANEESHADYEQFKIEGNKQNEDMVSIELNTKTMAEIYVNQGFYKKAMKIYQKILAENPEDIGSLNRIKEIKEYMESDEENGIYIDDEENEKFEDLQSIEQEIDLVFNEEELILNNHEPEQEPEQGLPEFRNYIRELIKENSIKR